MTEHGFRGRGLSVACAGALCEDIYARGRRPSWTTSPDNLPNLRVASKLGFSLSRRDRLSAIGVPIPPPATGATDREAHGGGQHFDTALPPTPSPG
ncbi:MAG: GNAT family N-acetyltransferase [Egibacteraceae bacterium]